MLKTYFLAGQKLLVSLLMLFQDLLIIQTPYKGSIEPFDVKLRLRNQSSFCRQSFAIKKFKFQIKIDDVTTSIRKDDAFLWSKNSSHQLSPREGLLFNHQRSFDQGKCQRKKEKDSITRNLHCWQKRLKFCFQSDTESFSHQLDRNWKLLNGREIFFATALFFVAAAPLIQNWVSSKITHSQALSTSY